MIESPVEDPSGIRWPWVLCRRLLSGGLVVIILSVPLSPPATYFDRVAQRFLDVLTWVYEHTPVGDVLEVQRDNIRREFERSAPGG